MLPIDQLDGYERLPISAPTRDLLCAVAAADPERPWPAVAADWDEVFRAIRGHGLLGIAQAHLARRPATEPPPPAFRRAIAQAQAVNALRMELTYRHVARVLSHLAAAGVDVMVVKGPAVAYTAYADPAWRAFSDLDLVAREAAWPDIHRRLLELGFRPETDRPRPPPKLFRQASPSEFKYWHPEDEFLVEVHYEDLLNAGLAARDVAGFWDRAGPIVVRGLPVTVMALDDQLIHLSAHVHYHGYTRLIWLADLAGIIRRHASAIDWQRLLATVRREEAQVPVYYSLRLVEQVLGVAAPAGVLTALRPDRLRRWLHEQYLPEARVRSLQPMPRPDFSFYFLPLFKRLVPDLLVMGRRGEKLRCLLRLLAPSPAWLRDYYHLGADQWVAVHYLLHPLKLASYYSREMATALFGSVQGRRARASGRPTAWWAVEEPTVGQRRPAEPATTAWRRARGEADASHDA